MTLPHITTSELMSRLDGGAFVLPPVTTSDYPTHRELRRGRVPGMTVDQLRVMRRYGLFAIPKAFRVKAGHAFPLTVWKAGDPRLLSVLDVATIRLYSWLRREGLTHTAIVSILRGRAPVRYVMSGTALARASQQELLIQDGIDACVFDTAFIDRETAAYPREFAHAHRFPLAWLGIEADVLPRMQKIREDQPCVTRWRQSWEPAALVAAQITERREHRV